MEVNLKEIVEKIVDDHLSPVKSEVDRLKAENKKLTEDNTELAEGFKNLLADQEEALDYIDDLECKLSGYEANEAADVDDDVTDCCGYCNMPCCEDPTLEFTPAIRNIFYCDEPGKEKTIVIFADGTKVIKELVAGDKFDLNVGVALCVAERMYGGKTKYHKMVKKVAGIKEKRNVVEEPAKKAKKTK